MQPVAGSPTRRRARSAPIPAFDGNRAAAKITAIDGGTPEGREATARESVAVIYRRFYAADRYVFGLPMRNAGIPWTLKQLKAITQPDTAFSFDPVHGYTGLLQDKKALAVYTSGVYSPDVDKAFGSDFQSTHFDDWLQLADLEDIVEIRYRPTLLAETPDPDLARAIAEAREFPTTF